MSGEVLPDYVEHLVEKLDDERSRRRQYIANPPPLTGRTFAERYFQGKAGFHFHLHLKTPESGSPALEDREWCLWIKWCPGLYDDWFRDTFDIEPELFYDDASKIDCAVLVDVPEFMQDPQGMLAGGRWPTIKRLRRLDECKQLRITDPPYQFTSGPGSLAARPPVVIERKRVIDRESDGPPFSGQRIWRLPLEILRELKNGVVQEQNEDCGQRHPQGCPTIYREIAAGSLER